MTVNHPPSPCPTHLELAEFVAGRYESLRPHVEHCRRCRALTRARHPESADEQIPPQTLRPSFTAVRPVRSADGELAVGSVVIAADVDDPDTLLVCVLLRVRPGAEPRVLDVAPVSTEVAMASEFDAVLELADPIGYRALVEVWNHGVILESQIRERLGRLSEKASAAVDALYRTLVGDEVPLDDVAHGVAIESDADPRAVFQEAELDRVGPFWSPAAHLYGDPAEVADTVGDVFGDWLEQTGWTIPAYAAHLGWRTEELEQLRDDAFEPLAVPPERVGTALASAAITSPGFEDALRRSIAIEQFIPPPGSAPAQGLAFARSAGRRRAAKRRAREPEKTPAEQAASDLETYVARAVRAFEQASDP